MSEQYGLLTPGQKQHGSGFQHAPATDHEETVMFASCTHEMALGVQQYSEPTDIALQTHTLLFRHTARLGVNSGVTRKCTHTKFTQQCPSHKLSKLVEYATVLSTDAH